MTSGEVIKLVTAFIWPVVVVLLAFAYREPMGRLLNRLTKLEAAGVKGEFNVPAEEVLDEAELVMSKGGNPDAAGDTQTLELINQAASQPWWAVHQAWRLVRWASKRAAGSEASDYPNTAKRVAFLERRGLVSKDVAQLAVGLHSLYYDIRAKPELLTPDAASDFVEASAQLVRVLQNVQPPAQGGTSKPTP